MQRMKGEEQNGRKMRWTVDMEKEEMKKKVILRKNEKSPGDKKQRQKMRVILRLL